MFSASFLFRHGFNFYNPMSLTLCEVFYGKSNKDRYRLNNKMLNNKTKKKLRITSDNDVADEEEDDALY